MEIKKGRSVGQMAQIFNDLKKIGKVAKHLTLFLDIHHIRNSLKCMHFAGIMRNKRYWDGTDKGGASLLVCCVTRLHRSVRWVWFDGGWGKGSRQGPCHLLLNFCVSSLSTCETNNLFQHMCSSLMRRIDLWLGPQTVSISVTGCGSVWCDSLSSRALKAACEGQLWEWSVKCAALICSFCLAVHSCPQLTWNWPFSQDLGPSEPQLPYRPALYSSALSTA